MAYPVRAAVVYERIAAAALFATFTYGMSVLVHAVVDLGALAWIAFMAGVLWLAIKIENRDRSRDGKPPYSLAESKELIPPLLTLAALFGGLCVIDYREHPDIVGAWVFAILAGWVAWNAWELRKERGKPSPSPMLRLPNAKRRSGSAT
jgi:hypothetical protein